MKDKSCKSYKTSFLVVDSTAPSLKKSPDIEKAKIFFYYRYKF